MVVVVFTQGDQDELRRTCRAVLEALSPIARTRARCEDGSRHDADLWGELGGLGWTSVLVPEDKGGLGWTMAEASVLLEELGRLVVLSPFFATSVLAVEALRAGGETSAELLEAIAAGELLGTVAFADAAGRCGPTRRGLVVSDRAGAIELHGEAGFVPDADVAGVVIAAARDDDGCTIAAVRLPDPLISVTHVPTVDRTRRLFRICFDGVRVPENAIVGERGEGRAIVDRVLDVAAIALAADSVGGARRVHEMSTEYAKARVQFDRPIGSFQAIKHRLADLYLLCEAAAVMVEAAALDASRDVPSPLASASVAKSYAADAYARVAGDAVLVHGAVGITFEHDLHMYLKRAMLNQQLFGSSAWHRERQLVWRRIMLDRSGVAQQSSSAS